MEPDCLDSHLSSVTSWPVTWDKVLLKVGLGALTCP
jgi:hypothetical protein